MNIRALRDFSLKCFHSQSTALVGSSGSGKSTAIALLQRFYDPIRGRILLDDYDLRDLNLRWLRSLMGLVQQEPVLFNLSIRENIAYGDHSRQVTQEEIENTAKTANIHDLIVSLPQVNSIDIHRKFPKKNSHRDMKLYVEQKAINYPVDKSKEVSPLHYRKTLKINFCFFCFSCYRSCAGS